MNHIELADLVREAAGMVDALTDDCSSFGTQWKFDPSNNWPTVGHIGTADDDPHGLIADLWPSAECGRYIAAMHPLVGKALVNLLEHVADDIQDDRAEEREFPNNLPEFRHMVVDGYGNTRHDWTAAVALARQILEAPAVVNHPERKAVADEVVS